VWHIILLALYGGSNQGVLSPPHNRAHSSYSPKNGKFRSLLLGHLSGARIEAPIGSGLLGRDLLPTDCGGVVSSLSGIRGGSPAANDFGAFNDLGPKEHDAGSNYSW
jgi:hypothetical protein